MKTTNPLVPKLQTEITSLKDRLARSMADYINLEKRIERDKQLLSALATTQIISQIIEVVDDLDLAYQNLQDPGLKMAIDKMKSTLRSYGLIEVLTIGQKFNPETMECVSTSEGENDIVLSVHKNGYTLNGQTLRPAQVIVGKKLN
jgi:molecular chaperone GrpE